MGIEQGAPVGGSAAEVAAYRAAMYRSASVAFIEEPSAEELVRLVNAAREAATVEGGEPCEAELLKDLATLDLSDPEALRTRVATEYAELFIGPRPPLAPMYESVYVGTKTRLFSSVTDSVRKHYERNGFSVVKRNRVPDDQIAYELEFMAEMCGREAACLDAGDIDGAREARGVQERFLTMHLAAWTGPFLERIEAAEIGRYYRAWARFVHSFVGCDYDYVIEERAAQA